MRTKRAAVDLALRRLDVDPISPDEGALVPRERLGGRPRRAAGGLIAPRVILVDTSAWIEYLRGTGSAADERLSGALRDGEELATTGIVLLELLAGARDEQHGAQLRRLLAVAVSPVSRSLPTRRLRPRSIACVAPRAGLFGASWTA